MKVAVQRLTAAEQIFETLGLNIEAQYIGGYCIECCLKALILHVTPVADRAIMLQRITRGASFHRPEVLLPLLKDRGITLTVNLSRRIRRFNWTTDLRYEIGRRDTGETNGMLKTAREIHDWVKEQLQ